MSKQLVAYFSPTSTTGRVAKKISYLTGADLYEIKPKTLYTKDDLDWNNKQSRSSIEMSNPEFRTPLADLNANIDDYDLIYIGFPIWWYIAPNIIYTFLDSYNFKDKTIVLFATSGSSPMGETMRRLQTNYSSSIYWKEQKRFGVNPNEEEISAWLKESNLL